MLRKRAFLTPVTIDTGRVPEPLRLLRKRAISTPSLRDSPFQGQAGSGGAFAGRLRCFDVCNISLPLRRALRPLRESLSDFAGTKSRDRAGALMSTS